MAGRVFIVGAGASRSDTARSPFPVPLATEFFTKKYLAEFWPKDLPRFADSALGSILAQYFGLPPLRGTYSPNVEEVYSFLDIVPAICGAHLQITADLALARQQLLSYIANVIRHTGHASQNLRLYSRIASTLREEDTIISFNWDLLLDNQLRETIEGQEMLGRSWALTDPEPLSPGDPYEMSAYRFREYGYYLKLHGSVDLAVCSNDTCRRRTSPFRFGNPEEIIHDWPCAECGSRLEVLLLPPHVHKTYRGSRYLRLLASLAAKRLFLAHEIIAMGYSFPPFDFEALSIFRASRLEPWETGQSTDFLRQFTVVNPSVSNRGYMKRLDDLFGLDRSKAHGQAVKLISYETAAEYIRS